jgi:hypothetical protein
LLISRFALAREASLAVSWRRITPQPERTMKRTTHIPIALALLAFAALPAAAGEGGSHSQQGKMKTCNDEARSKDLHGDERRAFMSSCLKGPNGDAGEKHKDKEKRDGGHAQQNKMKTCNDQARTKDLHGDERRAFMSSCLKAH